MIVVRASSAFLPKDPVYHVADWGWSGEAPRGRWLPALCLCSEGDVVILVVLSGALLLLAGLAAGEEGDIVGDDLDADALDVLFIGQANVVDAVADHGLLALFDIIGDGLANAVEAGDPMPLGLFDPAPVLLEDLGLAVALRARGREAKGGDFGAALGGAGLGGGADVAG